MTLTLIVLTRKTIMQPIIVANPLDRIVPDLCDALNASANSCSPRKCSKRQSDVARFDPSDLGAALLGWIGLPATSLKLDSSHTDEKCKLDARALHAQGRLMQESPRVPIWDQEPEPIKGWTMEDQRALILAAKEAKLKTAQAPRAYNRSMAEVARQFPHKTLRECEDCFRHVEKSRIVYFGPKKSRDND